MKVRTDHLTQLQQQKEQQQVRSREGTGKFGDMLAQEVQKTSPSELAKVSAPPPGARVLGAHALHALQGVSSVETQSLTEQEVMQNIDSILSKWEDYARQLDTPMAEESLRQAYGMLETIQNDVERIKADVPDLGQKHPSLHSMVNEIEIMAVTEQFKFNRGDYL